MNDTMDRSGVLLCSGAPKIIGFTLDNGVLRAPLHWGALLARPFADEGGGAFCGFKMDGEGCSADAAFCVSPEDCRPCSYIRKIAANLAVHEGTDMHYANMEAIESAMEFFLNAGWRRLGDIAGSEDYGCFGELLHDAVDNDPESTAAIMAVGRMNALMFSARLLDGDGADGACDFCVGAWSDAADVGDGEAPPHFALATSVGRDSALGLKALVAAGWDYEKAQSA